MKLPLVLYTLFWVVGGNLSITAADLEERKEGESPLLSNASPSAESSKKTDSPLKEDVNPFPFEYFFHYSQDLIAILETLHIEPVTDHFIAKINGKIWEKILGFREEEVIGNTLQEFIYPEDMQGSIEAMVSPNQDISSHLLCKFESRYRCKKGPWCWIEWSIFRHPEVFTGDKGNRKLLCTGRDITDKKKLEDKTKILDAVFEIQSAYIDEKEQSEQEEEEESQDQFIKHYKPLKIILNNFIKLTESEFGFGGELYGEESSSPYVRQVFSGMNETLIKENLKRYIKDKRYLKDNEIKKGKKISCFNNVLGDVINCKTCLIVNDFKSYGKPTGMPRIHLPIVSFLGFPLIAGDKVIGLVCLANRKQGYNMELFSWLEPLWNMSGRIMNELKLERWHREAKSQRIARQRAEASNEAKSAFLAHISHELRTPLTGILGLMDLINKEAISENDRKYLKMAKTSGHSLMSLVNDILDISRIEAGQLVLEKIELDPIKVTRDVMELLSPEAQKQENKLTLIMDPSIPHRLLGDPTRLRQILINLLGNAIKFTKKGAVSLELSGEPLEKEFLLKGKVTDTGIGMKPETISRLFQSFSQADQSIMRQFGGSGLGLYITKKLCILTGGGIDVQSTFGKGSTFSFSVKLGVAEAPAVNVPAGFKSLEKLSDLRVLVAEDNVVNQLVLREILKKEGCIVTVVTNGQEALEAVQREDYDVILMDGAMPVMDGLEATRKIREQFKDKFLPIIGVTAHAFATDKDRFLGSGMNGYLTKPIRPNVLKSEILRCLKGMEK